MEDSIDRIIERLMLIVFGVIVPAIFFYHQQNLLKTQMAKEVTTQFLNRASAQGYVTDDEYLSFVEQLYKLDYEVYSIQHTSYIKEPFYEMHDEEFFLSFFQNRNFRKVVSVSSSIPEVCDVAPDYLEFQEESNSTIFAKMAHSGYVQLPDSSQRGTEYRAVLPSQTVYVGEQLVTVLDVLEDGIHYYKQGDVSVASFEGSYDYQILIDGVPSGAVIHVTAYSRSTTCTHGHLYTATKDVLSNYLLTGEWGGCPFCNAYVQSISGVPDSVTVPLGTAFDSIPINVLVQYYDGHVGSVELSGISNNYDVNYCGEQDVVVSFGGVEGGFKLITTPLLCSSCGSPLENRGFMDSSQYPLCASCMQNQPWYLGNTFISEQSYGKKDFEAQITTGEYPLRRGDYLGITLLQRGFINQGAVAFNLLARQNVVFEVGDIIHTGCTD